MKRIITLLFILGSFSFFAQDTMSVRKLVGDTIVPVKDTSWKVNSFLGLNASLTQLDHWQGGGQNNIALSSVFSFEANYNDTKTIWLNKIDCQYGLMRVGSKLLDVKGFRKNIDRIFAQTKLDLPLKQNKHWFYTLVSDFRTQFAPGYNYRNDSVIGNATSDLTSPAYLQLALGFDYKPADYLTLTLAPLAGKITHVDRQYLADDGAYGVQAAVRDDSTGAIITHGKKTRFEFGGRVTLKFKKDITKNISLDTYIDLFSNYNHNPLNIDVVANNYLSFKINKLFSVNVISQMIYDDDIIIKEDLQADGSYKINGPRLQALTTISLGFGLKF